MMFMFGHGYSSYENVTSGVPQGSVLGPILFIIYINDLPDVIKVMMRMYADDSKCLRRIKTEHENQVQLSVNNSVTWANEWHTNEWYVLPFQKMSPSAHWK